MSRRHPVLMQSHFSLVLRFQLFLSSNKSHLASLESRKGISRMFKNTLSLRVKTQNALVVVGLITKQAMQIVQQRVKSAYTCKSKKSTHAKALHKVLFLIKSVPLFHGLIFQLCWQSQCSQQNRSIFSTHNKFKTCHQSLKLSTGSTQKNAISLSLFSRSKGKVHTTQFHNKQFHFRL